MDGDGGGRAYGDEVVRDLRLVGQGLLGKPGCEQVVRVAGAAPAAAGREAAQAAECLPDGDGGSHRVGVLHEGHLVLAHVPDGEQHRPDEAAVEDQAALPEFEDAGEVVRVLVPVDDDEEDPRADHRRDEDAEGEGEHLVLVEAAALGSAGGERHRYQEAAGDEDAVGVDGNGERPLEVEDVLTAEHLDGGEEERGGAQGPGEQCLALPGGRFAGFAGRAPLPEAAQERNEHPGGDAQRGRNGDGEEDGQHLRPSSALRSFRRRAFSRRASPGTTSPGPR